MWRFDGFVLDTQRYELRNGDAVVRVEPQVFDVLAQLVSYRERCVTKEELFDAVWGGRFVNRFSSCTFRRCRPAVSPSEDTRTGQCPRR